MPYILERYPEFPIAILHRIYDNNNFFSWQNRYAKFNRDRKIWSFQGGDYEECHLLGYKNPVRTSQDTYYVSTTESSPLMLCKIWGFHGSGYEGCLLLGYKNPVHTAHETNYVSAAAPSRLMLCKIWGLEGRGFETRWGEWFLSSYLILPVVLGPGFTQPLTEMSTRSIKIIFLGSKATAGA
jgi:hypothetical protein